MLQKLCFLSKVVRWKMKLNRYNPDPQAVVTLTAGKSGRQEGSVFRGFIFTGTTSSISTGLLKYHNH